MKRIIGLLMLAVLGFAGCARFQAQGGSDAEFRDADRLVGEKKYTEALAVYDKIAKESTGTERGANALYAGAVTRAYYDNPNRDFAQALQSFEDFLKAYPDNARSGEAQSWRSILKLAIDLKKENERLLRNIEQLKRIDIRHEQQRRKP